MIAAVYRQPLRVVVKHSLPQSPNFAPFIPGTHEPNYTLTNS